MNAISLGNVDVPPRQRLIVTLEFTAPVTPGNYNFQWQLYQDGGVGFFGQTPTNVAIQVSGFRDVPTTHVYYDQIERIAELGITLGCDGARYCTDDPVTREQMALFVERALGVPHPPVAPDQTFADVTPDGWSHALIEGVAHPQVNPGSGTGLSRLDPIPLDQMVTLLERAVGRPNPPLPQIQRFVDVPPSRWSYAFVDSFVQHGLSKGVMEVVKRDCNNEDGLRLYPERTVRRAEMAALIVIAFGL